MPCRVTLALAMAMFLPVAGSAPPPKGEDKPVLYLPTRVGDKRVFDVSHNGKTREVAEWVTAVEPKDGTVSVSFSAREGGPTDSQYRVSADGVVLVSDGAVREPPFRLLKLPPKDGETWEAADPAKPGSPGRKFKCTTAMEEEVEVPAGKFKAVRVEIAFEADATVYRTTYWHAPGVGLVKAVILNPGSTQVQVLKSFTPGGKR